jgi:hypothetical protein
MQLLKNLNTVKVKKVYIQNIVVASQVAGEVGELAKMIFFFGINPKTNLHHGANNSIVPCILIQPYEIHIRYEYICKSSKYDIAAPISKVPWSCHRTIWSAPKCDGFSLLRTPRCN